MKRIASQIVAGPANEGQYHFGYQTPDSSLAGAFEPFGSGGAAGAAGSWTVLATGRDLVPRVEPELVGVPVQLSERWPS